jgi:hypothetical protein
MKNIPVCLIILLSFLSACTDDTVKTATKPAVEVRLPKPFRFHKSIEIKPGLTYDVVSWGRGSETSGGYLILRSDSSDLKFKSFSGELDGQVKDAWNMDMDSDGNPEIFIQASGEGEGSYLNMYVFEFSSSGSSNEIRFPDLSSRSKEGYRGGDSIYVRDGKLFRQFPVYDTADTTAKKVVSKKLLQYGIRGNSINVDEVKEEGKQ